MITDAAIKTKNGQVYTDKRHHKIFRQNKNIDFKNSICGFVDETGVFLTRKEAAVVAYMCGQVEDEAVLDSVLMSEDLW